MIISTKGRYAVMIMLDVAVNEGAEAVRIADISARQGITHKYAEQLTSLLVKAGLLRSVRGTNGGYFLTRPAREYRISEILRKTEGELLPVSCVSEDDACEKKEGCAMYMLWNGLYKTINEYFDGITLADLADYSAPSDNYCI